MVFDGSNILVTSWNEIIAVRPSDGAIVARIPTISDPYGLAFDGARIFVLCDGFFQAPDSLVVPPRVGLLHACERPLQRRLRIAPPVFRRLRRVELLADRADSGRILAGALLTEVADHSYILSPTVSRSR